MLDSIALTLYRSEEEMLTDCRIMFANCRLYNEEGSEIYETANVLERVLTAKGKEMGLITEKVKKSAVGGGAGGAVQHQWGRGGLMHRIKTLYDTLKDYR